ncbi:MAG TPA: polysaccharide deacetylase family protein [Ramlibacter sp.]|nr:polysaccharide deacetylase family protein [Ramlibacter sp.]
MAPGFALTFDDDYVSEWHGLRPLLARHDTRATFFVTRPHRLAPSACAQLHELAADGHEIGAHGYEHRGVLRHYGGDASRVEAWEREELLACRDALQAMGFAPTSFAFPYGEHAPAYVERARRHFRLLRLIGSKRPFVPVSLHRRVFRRPEALSAAQGAMILDDLFGPTLDQLRRLLRMASDRGWVLCFFAHKPGQVDPAHTAPDDDAAYRISPERLERVLAEAQALGLRSYTASELAWDPLSTFQFSSGWGDGSAALSRPSSRARR